MYSYYLLFHYYYTIIKTAYISFSITCLVPPKIIPFTFGDDPMNFGETVSVSCIISGGDLPIDLFWYFNGRALNDYDNLNNILLEKKGKKLYLLMIESLSAKHIGNYTCSAKNTAGIDEYSAILNVNG